MIHSNLLVPVAINGVFKPSSEAAACSVICKNGGARSLCSNHSLHFSAVRMLCGQGLDEANIRRLLLTRDFTKVEAREICRLEPRTHITNALNIVDTTVVRDRMLRREIDNAKKLAASHASTRLSSEHMTAKLAVAISWIGSEILGDNRQAWETYLVLVYGFNGTITEAARAALRL